MTPRSDADGARYQALLDSDERYRAFVMNSSEAIWRFELEEPVPIDLDPDEQIDRFYRHGYLAECNDNMALQYGFESTAEIIGARLGDMVVRDNPDNIEYLRAFIASGYRLVGAESQEVDRDGNVKYFVNNLIGVIEDGFAIRAWGTQRDITEQKRILARLEFLADVTALLASSLDYDQTLRNVAAAAVPRIADWCFIDVIDENEEVVRVAAKHSDPAMVDLVTEMERRYPSPADMEVGPPLTIRTGITQSFDISDAMLQTLSQSEEHLAMFRTLAFRAGLVVPLIAHGRTVGALSFANSQSGRRFTREDIDLAEDIGRRAGLAIENARLYGELDRANRAKDDFLAMLSHELRTPMTATLGWATVLQTGGFSAETLHAAAESIVQSTRAQARLIDDLLDISRIVSGKLQLTPGAVRLRDAIHSAVDTIRPAAEARQIGLSIDLEDADVRLQGDAARLQQVFWNLLSNAVKFTPRGGKVEVAVSSDADSVRLVVRDDGEGIPRDVLPHIFERFRQGEEGTTRRHGGLGLGLSIAKNLVELHGGTLTAASDGAGKGAAFTVTLPLGPVAGEVASARREAGIPQPLAGLRLLVVEDDDATRSMLEGTLRHFGAHVMTAVNSDDAFDELAANPIDVVLSDVGLPGEDGCALLTRIRATGSHVPAIAITAYANESERDRALAAGFHTWLAKPIDARALAAEIRRLVDRH